MTDGANQHVVEQLADPKQQPQDDEETGCRPLSPAQQTQQQNGPISRMKLIA